jgi:non-ribosomal peptide synthetase component F
MLDTIVQTHISYLAGEKFLFNPQKCIHEYVDEYATVTPEAIAVICGDQEINYFWLSKLAINLAAKLHDLGVLKNHIVAISMDRSIESIISVLASIN